MIKIAHRGNVSGPNVRENEPQFIEEAIQCGFEAEIDLRWIEGSFWLGHDAAQYRVSLDWLQSWQSKFWIHCKDADTFLYVKERHPTWNFFWHDHDDYTLTSKGIIWSRPGKRFDKNVVVLMPELSGQDFQTFSADICYGVCTDFPSKLP